jgi:glycosyltransferase involved in cell wall biosynthesis
MKITRRWGFLSGIKEQINFWLMLKKINADVFIHRARGIDTWVVSLFCRFNKKNFIFMTANLPDVDKSFRRKKYLAGWLYEMGLKKADVVIAQNEDHNKLLKINYGKEAVVIKNSFNIAEKNGDIQRKFILWVSNSRSQKRPEIFLKLAKDFPDENFVMIMPKSDIRLWKRIYSQISLIENLEFIEKVPFNKIDKYFNEAKVFVNTSLYEGFPNTFIQAAMYGTPIISLLVNPDNFIDNYKCGYAAEGNYDKMKKQLNEILHNREIWEKFSENEILYVRENHDIEKNIIKLKQIINNLTKEV